MFYYARQPFWIKKQRERMPETLPSFGHLFNAKKRIDQALLAKTHERTKFFLHSTDPFLLQLMQLFEHTIGSSRSCFGSNPRVPSNLNVWARRSLQVTFSPFCKCNRYSTTTEIRQPEYRNPDHRINKVLYLYSIKMNYFQGFSTQDVAKYLHMKGSYEGIRPKFTPMVHTLTHTAFKSP